MFRWRNAIMVAFLGIHTLCYTQSEPPKGMDSLALYLNNQEPRAILVYANQIATENHDKALIAYDIALKKAVETQNRPVVFAAFRDKGVFWEEQGVFDSASVFYGKALDYAQKNELQGEVGTVLNDLAIVSRKQGKYDDAKNYHLQALERAERYKDEEMVEFTWHGLGFMYEIVGDHEQSLRYYQKSFDAAQQRGHQNGMMVTLGNLAEVYASTGKKEEAIGCVEKGLTMAFTQKDTEQIAQLLFIQGDIFEQFGQLPTAQKNFEAALPYYQMLNDKSSEVEINLRLGAIAEKNNQLSQALHLYKSSLKHPSFVPTQLLAEANLKIGKVMLLMKDADGAFPYLHTSNVIAHQYHHPEIEIESAQEITHWYQKNNDHGKSLAYLERVIFLRDSLADKLQLKGSQELGFRYDLEKNKRALETLEIGQSRIRTILVLLIGLFGALALGFLISMRRKANLALSTKNEAIREQNLRLEESNKFLHQFTYAVAHDLKEPLRTVSGFITLLERRHGKHFTGDGIEYMHFVQKGVKKMHELISDLLTFSNISSQRSGNDLVNSKEVFDMVVARMAEVINEKKGEVKCSDNMPYVKISYEHLGYIFQNLIDNGLKFNDSDRPMLFVDSVRKGGEILFSVKDNGIGIDREHSKKIFDLFNQLHKNKPYGGTGIGLTICKNILDKYNGSIWFESEKGHGTCFWFSLPAH